MQEADASYSSTATDNPPSDQAEKPDHSELIKLAVKRFKRAYAAHTDDFTQCEKVQDFIAGDHWDPKIKKERENFGRPCLTLDHTNQYVRHVINTGLLRYRDMRALAMDGDASDDVAEIIAGIIRQVTQTSTAKVAYETGLRHSTSVGFGYWQVKVQPIDGTDLVEIVIHKIREPRMVLIDPNALYPDGRDAGFGFVLISMDRDEFNEQYPGHEDATSWHAGIENSVLPFNGDTTIVLAEYYYKKKYTDPKTNMERQGMFFAVMAANAVLDEGKFHGDAMPIIRVVGDEYEHDGKERKRGMINNSSMDGARAYDYSASSFIENVALAPLAPWLAAEGQVEQYQDEWKDAHRIPRAVLRYKPTDHMGQVLPPPQRSMPAGIPEGWQGMMENLVNSQQMTMGLSQPNMLGTGGIPVQSGAGVEAQQEPGDVNTFHFVDHWHGSIEQTGRVILAMIPHVYKTLQIVKTMGEDGALDTAIINPEQQQAVMQDHAKAARGLSKAQSTSYNPMLGRYDITISTGPPSATKKSAASKGMLGLIQADPTVMQKAPDLVVKNMDIPGADVLAKRLKAFLPPGIAEDDETKVRQMVAQLSQQNQEMQAQLQEAQQIILGEQQKKEAEIQKAVLHGDAKLAEEEQRHQAEVIQLKLEHEGEARIETIRGNVKLECNVRDNVFDFIIEKMKAENKLDVEAVKSFMHVSTIQNQQERITGYAGVLDGLQTSDASPSNAPVESAPAPPTSGSTAEGETHVA